MLGLGLGLGLELGLELGLVGVRGFPYRGYVIQQQQQQQ